MTGAQVPTTVACPHTDAVTTGTLEKMHWEVLPHLTYIVLTWFQAIFTCLVQSERPQEENDLELMIQQWLDKYPKIFFFF
jgi:hypothetical protein